MTRTYSQIGQEMAVAQFFKHRHNGYFVEVGAYNGIDFSNTNFLERRLGWRGICIEPLPHEFELLRQNRQCICVQSAVYSAGGLELEFVIYGTLSGITKHIDKHTEILDSPKIQIRTKTLTDILNTHHAPIFIEYLSLDTEGSELEILRGIDFDKYTFGYITIEPRRTDMRDFLQKHGYLYLRENQFDDDYISKTNNNLITITK